MKIPPGLDALMDIGQEARKVLVHEEELRELGIARCTSQNQGTVMSRNKWQAQADVQAAAAATRPG